MNHEAHKEHEVYFICISFYVVNTVDIDLTHK